VPLSCTAGPSPGADRRRPFFGQLATDVGFVLDWQHLDANRNTAASAAIMRGDATLMRAMLDELLRER
jgi:hypothetical protein